MNDPLPEPLCQFISQHIESLAQLEALLVMRQSPQRHWPCAELAQALYISEDMCRGMLIELDRRALVTRSGGADAFRYAGADSAINGALEQLAAFYQERRVAVISQIYSNSNRKVQTFADAFRIRKEGSQ